MEFVKTTVGVSGNQLANGTPADKVFILKSFYKDDRCVISPAKDINGRYLGINMNIPEIKKLEMGYVPSPASKVKLYDGMEINLNNADMAKDWEWMQHCQEIATDYQSGQASPGAYFYIFRPGAESARKVSETSDMVKSMNYVLQDAPENLYNRATILGVDMSGAAISDVQDFLLTLATNEPARLRAVYESPTFTLELLFMHAEKKGIITNRSGVFTFGEILLGVDNNAVVSYFSNPKNAGVVRAIEAMTYGTKSVAKNPLENEARNDEEYDSADMVASYPATPSEAFKAVTDELEVANPGSEDIIDTIMSEGSPESTLKEQLTPQQRAAITRANNAKK
jgi:hypothetical protein